MVNPAISCFSRFYKFKRIKISGKILDRTSAVHAVAGAPDPTFGHDCEETSQWQRSLNALNKMLVISLKNINSSADTSFDRSEVCQSALFCVS